MKIDREKLAAILLMKTMQQQTYPEKLAFLPAGTSLGWGRGLDLYIDEEGLIRLDGRIGNFLHFNIRVNYPILLAKHHLITRPLIMDAHVRYQHLGVGSTLSEVRRSGYWVPKGRQAVKTVLGTCALCRRYNVKHLLSPNVANLLTLRVQLEVPTKTYGSQLHWALLD